MVERNRCRGRRGRPEPAASAATELPAAGTAPAQRYRANASAAASPAASCATIAAAAPTGAGSVVQSVGEAPGSGNILRLLRADPTPGAPKEAAHRRHQLQRFLAALL